MRPTRRTVVVTAAWTAPTVIAANAAPAFASSVLSDGLHFHPGTTYVEYDGAFHNVWLEGASVEVVGPGGPSTLTMTVTFQPTAGNDYLYSELTAPAGWQHEPRTLDGRNVLVFTYLTPVSAGDVVPMTDGFYFGTDDVAQHGTFVLTFSAANYVGDQWTISTP